MKEWLIRNQNNIEKYFIFVVVIYFLSSIVGDVVAIFRDKIEVREVINFYVRWMQNILFLSVPIYYLSKLKLKTAVSISTILGYFEVDYAFFANSIFPIFISNESNISPEYMRIGFFILIMLSIFIKIFINREKFKDTFLLLSMLGVMGTSVIFHLVTTSQLTYFNKEQEARWEKIYNRSDLKVVCSIEKLTCGKIEKNKPIDNELVTYYYENSITQEYIHASQNYYRYFIISDLSIKNRIQARKPLAFIKNNDGAFYIYDNDNYTKYLKFNELLFGSLSMVSHIVWIFGAYYLIWFHTRKKKNNPNNNINLK